MENYTPSPEMQSPTATPLEIQAPPAVEASTVKWTKLIKAARKHWEPDFKRMRSDMEFAAGYQWPEQQEMDDPRYITNLVARQINQKVAALYAKNPTFAATRRRRLDYKIWDGRMESIQQAVALSTSPEATPEVAFGATALLSDYSNGRMTRDLIDKVGMTLETILTWYTDNLVPSFKKQMKQMVRRTITTGVGYIKVNFAREQEGVLSETSRECSIGDRLRAAQQLMTQMAQGEIDENSPELVQLQAILSSLQNYDMEQGQMNERLEFDFPASTSIIVDRNCRSLQGFVGAKWIAHEFIMSLDDVNAHFGTEIKGTDISCYNESGNENYSQDAQSELDKEDRKVCFWEIYHLPSRSKFVILDGYKNYLEAPASVEPETHYFWPIFALTFNEVEVEPDRQRATIFPPSDVQLLRSPQKEINRSRQDLKDQRIANRPKYLTTAGKLTADDKDALILSKSNAVIELQGATSQDDLGKIFVPFQHAAIDPMMYDTSPLMQDVFLANGNEEGAAPASTKATATAATINEQSRAIVTTSNVDDLDDFMSDFAESCGEILLRELSPETVYRIAGDGAVWPDINQNREDFIQYVYLQVKAASSGRPNKALEISNFTQIAPILQLAGVSPQFIAREAIKRLDDRLDLDEAFALGPASAAVAMPMAPPQQTGQAANPARGAQGPSQTNQMPPATQPQPKVQEPKN